jgi:hypothetical protein
VTTQTALSQRARLAILIVYIVGLLGASRAALGTWLPPTSDSGLWFYAALAALLLGSLLVTPFFTKPADAISYAVAAVVALLAVNTWRQPQTTGFDRFTWAVTIAYVGFVLAVALINIAFKDSSRPTLQRVARSSFLLADTLGNPRAVFSAVFLFALVTYHRAAPREYIIIGFSWALLVGFRPLESLAVLLRRLYAVWGGRDGAPRLGEVVGHEAPGLVLIREDPERHAVFGDMIHARAENGRPGIAVALDHVGFATGRWLRAIHAPETQGKHGVDLDSVAVRAVCAGAAFGASPDSLRGDVEVFAKDVKERLIGIVAADTNVGQLQIELARSDLDIREGALVQVEVGGRPVLYQIIEGLTREEILQ